MSDDHYGEGKSIEQALTAQCETLYYGLLGKLQRHDIPAPSITVIDNDQDSYCDMPGIFLQSAVAEQPEDERLLTISRIATCYLQYHKNQRIRAILENPEPTEAQGLQAMLFVGTAMTHGSLHAIQEATGAKTARQTAEAYRTQARREQKSCVHKYSIWYGADAFLRDIPLDRVLALWSPRCLNRAKLTHMEGVEPYLARIKEAVRLENDGSGV